MGMSLLQKCADFVESDDWVLLVAFPLYLCMTSVAVSVDPLRTKENQPILNFVIAVDYCHDRFWRAYVLVKHPTGVEILGGEFLETMGKCTSLRTTSTSISTNFYI